MFVTLIIKNVQRYAHMYDEIIIYHNEQFAPTYYNDGRSNTTYMSKIRFKRDDDLAGGRR